MRSPSSPPSWRSVLLLGVAALLIVATVPYFVPVRPAVSDSYIFGYNNRVGIALFLLFAAFGAWWTSGARAAESDTSATPISMGWLWGGMALAVLLSMAMYRLVAPLNGFGESTYFLHRLQLLASGRVPYRDFEFAYGAAMLYGPLWIMRLAHVGLTQAYYLFWMGWVVAGVAVLFGAVRMTGDRFADRTGVFLIFYAISLFGILTTGLNYSIVRFCTALLAAACIARLREREASSLGSSVATVAATLVLLLISPEMAVAFAMASVAYFGIEISWRDRPAVIVFGSLVCALAILLAVANSFGVFNTMRAFSSGGNNFPIYVAPSIAVFFAATWFALRSVLRGVSSVLRYWIILGVVLTPAALGRCDAGHILSYAMGIFLAVALVLTRRRVPRLWVRISGAAYVLLVVLPSLRVEYVPFTAAAAARSSSSIAQKYANWALGEKQAEGIRESVVTPKLDLPPGDMLLAPFSYRPNRTDVVPSSSIEYGYYEGMTNVLTPEQVRFKLQEIATHPEMPLLLPRQWVSYCLRTADNSRVLLSGLFGVPYIKQPAHEMDLYMPVCDYIRANYRNVPPRAEQELGEFDLWARK